MNRPTVALVLLTAFALYADPTPATGAAVTQGKGASGRPEVIPWSFDFGNCDGDGGVSQFSTSVTTSSTNLDVVSSHFRYVVVTNHHATETLWCRYDSVTPVFGGPGVEIGAKQAVQFVTRHTLKCVSNVDAGVGGVNVGQDGCR